MTLSRYDPELSVGEPELNALTEALRRLRDAQVETDRIFVGDLIAEVRRSTHDEGRWVIVSLSRRRRPTTTSYLGTGNVRGDVTREPR